MASRTRRKKDQPVCFYDSSDDEKEDLADIDANQLANMVQLCFVCRSIPTWVIVQSVDDDDDDLMFTFCCYTAQIMLQHQLGLQRHLLNNDNENEGTCLHIYHSSSFGTNSCRDGIKEIEQSEIKGTTIHEQVLRD